MTLNSNHDTLTPGKEPPVLVSRPTTPCGSLIPHPPSFKIKLKDDTEVLAGCTVHHELLVKGYPLPTLKFYKNQLPLKEDDRIKVIFYRPDFCELLVSRTRLEDSAVYEVLAINELGSATTSGVLRVLKNKALFSPGHRSRSSSRASTPSLNINSMFRWFKDGVEFDADERYQCHYSESDNTIALNFLNVKPRDAGVYTCVAQTSRGKISCSAELKAGKTKAIFKRKLIDFQAEAGDENVDLTVKLDGSPKPLIQWLFEGKEIRETDGFRFLKGNEDNCHTLRIKRVDTEMTGTFTCEAFNSSGKSETSGRLTVASKPKFIQVLSDLEVAIESNVTLVAKIVGHPIPEVTWFKNSSRIEMNERISWETNPQENLFKLLIENFSPEDVGEYTLEARNNFGRVGSSCRAAISEKPCFRVKLQDRNAKQDEENIEFVVQLEPLPEVESVKWFVDDIEIIPMDKRYMISSDLKKNVYKLIVKKANEGTAGSYLCVATNAYGKTFSAASLKVTSPPEFMQGLEDRQALPGDSVTMDVVVSGSPVPRVQWFRNNRELTGSSDSVKIEKESDFVHILTVEKMKETSAEYECVITNEFGESRTKGRLTVISEDGTPSKELEVGNFRIDVEDLPDRQESVEEEEEEEEEDEQEEEEEQEEGEQESTLLEQEELIPGDELYHRQFLGNEKEDIREQEHEIRAISNKRNEESENEPKDTKSRRNEPTGEQITAKQSSYTTYDVLKEIDSNNYSEDNSEKTPKDTNNEEERRGSFTWPPAQEAPCFLEELQMIQERFDGGHVMAEISGKVNGFPRPDLKWYLNDTEIDPICSKYNLQYNDDGCVRLAMRRVRASDAGLYSLKISNVKGNATSTVELVPETEQRKMSFVSFSTDASSPSVYDCNHNLHNTRVNSRRESKQFKDEGSFMSSLLDSVKQLFSSSDQSTKSSREQSPLLPLEVTPEGKYKFNTITLIVGGAVFLSGIYLLMRLVFPSQLQDCGQFSHDLANNVHEWMFKCTAVSSKSVSRTR